MKKLFFGIAILCLTGCGNSVSEVEAYSNEVEFSSSEEHWLNYFYEWCLEVWGEDIPQYLHNNRIAVIRYCDSVMDPYGDILCEMEGYEVIYPIVWPDGYNI